MAGTGPAQPIPSAARGALYAAPPPVTRTARSSQRSSRGTGADRYSQRLAPSHVGPAT